MNGTTYKNKDDVVQLVKDEPNFRVKVYLLDEIGNWEDCGTGNLKMIKDASRAEELEFFEVIAEDDQEKAELTTELLERQQMIRGHKTDHTYILYRPLIKSYPFERQEGI